MLCFAFLFCNYVQSTVTDMQRRNTSPTQKNQVMRMTMKMEKILAVKGMIRAIMRLLEKLTREKTCGY